MQNTRALSAPQNGFTLVELMIVVTIIAILVGIAYPSYVRQAQKAGRSDATTALLAIAAAQEKEFLKNNAFTSDLSVLGITETDADKYVLQVEVPVDNTSAFLARAKAREEADGGSQSQSGDVKCKYFTIDQTGAKRAGAGATPADDANNCW
jgi:type IV pilus assembly protein PilE